MSWERELARTNLVSVLERTCRTQYDVDRLTEAVSKTQADGMAEIQRLARSAFCTATGLQETGVEGVLASDDGTGYLFNLAPDHLNPSVLTLSVLAYAGVHERLISQSWQLSGMGRYGRLDATFPVHVQAAVATTAEMIAGLIDTLTAWIEQQMQIAVGEFHRRVSGQVYAQLSRVTAIDFEKRLVDIAIIGATGAWRLPHAKSIDRTLRRLRATSAKHDAELLSASFVGSILPRDTTLMVEALHSDHSIVRPYANAPWYTARSFFALATRLRHEGEDNKDTTSSMLAVHTTDKLSVVLIFPATDATLRTLLEPKTQEISAYISGNLSLFRKTLDVVEKTARATDLQLPDGMSRVFKILAYETDDTKSGRTGWPFFRRGGRK
jgi:hypothetical protein